MEIEKKVKSIYTKKKHKYLKYLNYIIVLLIYPNLISGQIPELPEWINKVYYIDPSSNENGDGSFDNPWNDFRQSECYSTIWPRVGWDCNNTALLFKRGTALGEKNPLKASLVFSADSIYIGSYGEGPKAKIIFDNNSRGIRVNGNSNTISFLEVANLDTANYSEVVTIGGKNGTKSPPRSSVFYSDSLVISHGFRGLVIGGFRRAHIINAVIYNLNHDGVYATNSDSLIFEGVHVYNINKDWAWTHDLNQAGGDCIQTTGYSADSRVEVIIIENCILDHSYWGGKFALITNENDTTIIRNSVLKANHESVCLYASNTFAENTVFVGGQPCSWSHTISKSANRYYNCIFIGPGKDYFFDGERNGQALWGTYMDIYNCTFVDWQYVFYVPGINPNVRNSIFYNVNTAFNIGYRRVDGSGNIHYNSDGSIQKGLNLYETDSAYLIEDPLFLDYNSQDFRLKPNSPAIDAADMKVYDKKQKFVANVNLDNESFIRNYTHFYTVKKDFFNNDRPIGKKCDIGAVEYLGIDSDDSEQSALRIFPNPANQYINVYYNLNNDFKNVNCSVINSAGEIIIQSPVHLFKTGLFKMNLANYSSGIYYLRLTSDKKIIASASFILEK